MQDHECTEESLDLFKQMSKGEGQMSKYKCLVYKLDLAAAKVVPDRQVETKDCTGDDAKDWETMVGELPHNECRYVLYDFHFETRDARPTSALLFLSWYVHPRTEAYLPERVP